MSRKAELRVVDDLGHMLDVIGQIERYVDADGCWLGNHLVPL